MSRHDTTPWASLSGRALRVALAVAFCLFACMPAAAFADDGDGDDDGDEPATLPEGAASDPAMFQALISNPQFQQLRALLRAQPQMLDVMLNQFQQSNPDVYRILVNNRDAFVRWLSEDSAPANTPS